ncbi:MAG TPA: c-type cytochrome [Thermoanaerobaculia bacterium]|jgi:cytochrome c553|nr:c-type cytochrome [Thermoanaerobaculia bacterium]
MKNWKPILLAAGLAAGAAALIAASPKAAPKAAAMKTARSGSAAIARGKYLVSVLACNDCHTPKKMGPNGPEIDMTKMLIGYVGKELSAPPASGPWIAHTTDQFTAWAGPWGISYAKNLTPDENTGIGSWSEETFVKAIRTGKHMGVSRPILPPMPWNVYVNLTDADLKAVYAYLRSLPPVHNPQPDPTPPPPAPAGQKP